MKTKVPVAAQPLHKFPIHDGHITTSNFMRFDVAFARELAPSKIKFNHQEFVRTLPLLRPLMTNVQIHNVAAFVPFRTVWEPYTDFKVDTPHNQPAGTGIISNVPLIDEKIFWDMMTVTTDPICTQATAAQFTANQYDFTRNGTTGYICSIRAKWILSIMRQLGYALNPRAVAGQTVSALPLLCLCKLYLDFYYPNAYAHYGNYAILDGIMQRQVSYTLTLAELQAIFEMITYVCYNDDYFINAFDEPSGPNNGVGSFNMSIPDVTLDGTNSANPGPTVDQDPLNGTPLIDVTQPYLSQYQLDNLKRLSSYVRRHALSGSRALERYLLEWGIALDADKLKRCIKIDEKRFPIQIGEVMSQADTYLPASSGGSSSGAALGDYSGRAVAYDGSLNFEFETKEFGYLFIISTIIPSVGYVQGRDRSTMHKTKLDFLTGEFDGIVTPIDQNELFVGLKRNSPRGSLFGFTGGYPEYKKGRDVQSGLFMFPDTEKGLLGWESNRLFSDMHTNATFNIVHSLDFMLGVDSDQYDRIFMDSSKDNTDKFICMHRMNYEIIQNALPLYDFFDWYDEDHQKINIEVNGVKTN